MIFDDKQNTIQQNKLRDIQTWTDLFKYTIEVTKQQTHCSTLAYFSHIVQHYDSEKGFGIAAFTPFPLTTDQEQYVLNAYYFKSDTESLFSSEEPEEDKEENEDEPTIETKTIFCILFMDYNFISSLKTNRVVKTRDEETHSLTYAVVINTL